ncbi:MAG TPA: FtsX-like permease family protein [Planctomycetota bacterium]|nr:FtsX-like permease family protein [Planctomycetota bacterium]
MRGRMYRWFLVYKYLFSRVITFSALVVIASSVSLLIVIVSVMEGFRSELEGRIRGTSSDLKVEGKRYIGLENPDGVAEIISRVPGVRATAPYVETLALYRSRGRVHREGLEHRYLRVVDLERELQMGDLAKYIEAVKIPGLPADPRVLFSREWSERGLWEFLDSKRVYTKPLPGPAGPPPELVPLPPPVLLGKEALKRDFVFPGEVVRLTAYSPTTQGPCTMDFLVAGYFKTGLYEVDSQGIFLERAAAREFLHLTLPDGGEVASGVRIDVLPSLKGDEDLRQVQEAVEAAIDEAGVPFARVLSWKDEKASLLDAVQVEKALMSVILGVIILFGALMMFIILTVLVVEKTRDVGVLQSLGATPAGVAAVFFRIGVTLCLAGTAIGTVHGVVFALSVNIIQRWIKLLTGWEVFPQKIYYLDGIPVRFEPSDLAWIIVPTVLASLCAAFVPASWAAKKDPVVSLRYE